MNNTAEQRTPIEATTALGEKILTQLRTVFDPEIPVNIYDLGLIYKVDIQPAGNGKSDVHIDMTLTSPNCPVAGQMPAMVAKAVENLTEVNDVKVDLTFNPPWTKDRMTDEAKLQLNMF
jgi:FeS assembly SUF system protein